MFSKFRKKTALNQYGGIWFNASPNNQAKKPVSRLKRQCWYLLLTVLVTVGIKKNFGRMDA